MEAHDFFLALLIILLTARLFAELATRQRDLRRYGYHHCPDHIAATLCHEVVLRALW